MKLPPPTTNSRVFAFTFLMPGTQDLLSQEKGFPQAIQGCSLMRNLTLVWRHVRDGLVGCEFWDLSGVSSLSTDASITGFDLLEVGDAVFSFIPQGA
jgi:hypothetical protein